MLTKLIAAKAPSKVMALATALALATAVPAMAAPPVHAARTARATPSAKAAGVTYYTGKKVAKVPPPGKLGYLFPDTLPKKSKTNSGAEPDGSNSTFTGKYNAKTRKFHPAAWATVQFVGQNGSQSLWYPRIKISGKSYHIGEYFNNFGYTKGNLSTLLTITLGKGAPRSFRLCVFADIDNHVNRGGAVDLLNGKMPLVNGGYAPTGVDLLASVPDKSSAGTHYGIYRFDVKNVAPGDVFTLAATLGKTAPPKGYVMVDTGGITLDKIPAKTGK